MGTASCKLPIVAKDSGYIQHIDCRAIGYALVRVKAGRMKVSDQIDYGAGALLIPKIGDYVRAGDPLGELLCNDSAQALPWWNDPRRIPDCPDLREGLILDISENILLTYPGRKSILASTKTR